MPKVFAIYSTGKNDIGLDNLENDTKGIYIYEYSLDNIQDIKDGDIVLLLQTHKQTVFLFTFKKESMSVQISPDKEWAYVVVPSQILEKWKYENISVATFKNLYFIRIDALSTWVRAPFGSRKNVLVFHPWIEILEDFANKKKLSEALGNPEQFVREYIISDKSQTERTSDREVLLKYNPHNGEFGKEISIFWESEVAISGKTVTDCLTHTEHKKNRKIFDAIKDTGEKILKNYTEYYDLTRVMDFKEELTKMTEEIEGLESKLQELKEQNLSEDDPEMRMIQAEIEVASIEKRDFEKELMFRRAETEMDIRMDDNRRKNDDNATNNKLKKEAFYVVVIFMGMEVIWIFAIFILTGLNTLEFEPWNLNLFIGATISQITAIFYWIIKHLFPRQ